MSPGAFLVVVFIMAWFVGFIVYALRDVDQLRAHVDREEQLDALWGHDDEVAA